LDSYLAYPTKASCAFLHCWFGWLQILRGESSQQYSKMGKSRQIVLARMTEYGRPLSLLMRARWDDTRERCQRGMDGMGSDGTVVLSICDNSFPLRVTKSSG